MLYSCVHGALREQMWLNALLKTLIFQQSPWLLFKYRLWTANNLYVTFRIVRLRDVLLFRVVRSAAAVINERHLPLNSHSSRLWNGICKHSSLSHSIPISSKDVSSNSTCNASSRHPLNCSWQARILPVQRCLCYFLKLQERPASAVIIEPLAIIWRWWNVRTDCFSVIIWQVDATKLYSIFQVCYKSLALNWSIMIELGKQGKNNVRCKY